MIKKLSNYYLNMSMQNKLLVTYLPIVTFAILCISFMSYRAIIENMYKQSFDMNQQSISQMKIVLDKNLNYYETFLIGIYHDPDDISFIKGDYRDAFEEYTRAEDLIERLGNNSIKQGAPLNLSIIREGNFNEKIYNDFDKIKNIEIEIDYLEMTNFSRLQIYNSKRVEDREWYKTGIGMNKGQWIQVQDDKKYNNLSYVINIKDIPRIVNTRVYGLLKLTVRMEDILAIDQEELSTSIYPYLLYDIDGNLLYIHPSMKQDYNSQKTAIDNFAYSKESEEKEQVVEELVLVKDQLIDYGLILVGVTSLKSVMLRIILIRNMILIISSLLMLLVVVLTVILSRFYVKRLLTVVGYLEKFHEGDFNELIPYMNEDEVGYLAKAFNDMSKEIKLLVHKIYKSELELKEIEFSLLQHQINPHFLYNSLSYVSRLDEFGDKNNIKKMVQALVSFYRLTLSNGSNIITIKNEIEHIRSYISVFEIRMGEIMNVHYDLDEKLYDYKTIKIILQPFVENILEHGIYRRKNSPINICIRLYEKGDYVQFEVVDDGIGITREKLQLLKQGHLEGQSGYAIKNVDRRLKLQYEEKYLLDIYSHLGIGTQVIIRIPKLL